MNYYEHHIGDYDADTSHLSWLEDMAYTRLIRLYYRKEAPIPSDVSQACRLVRALSKEERKAVETVLREFFELRDDGWHQRRCDIEVARYQKRCEHNRSVGKKGGRPKKTETRMEPETITQQEQFQVPEMEPEKNPSGYFRVPEKNPPQTPDPNKEEEAIASLSESAPPIPPPSPIASIVPCPIDAVLDRFAERLPMLPQVRRSLFKAGKGADALRSRWRWVMTSEHERGERSGQRLATSEAEGIAWFDRYFSFVSESDFLTGSSGKWTACDLGWLLTASHFEAVLSGKYHAKEGVAA